MTRKLATIQRVLNVRPIVGADMIEAVDVLGWTIVCKKGDFQQGDLCVYFEIDSFLPAENPAFTFLKDKFRVWDGKEGMRLRTIKLRKQISQGLVLKVADFPELEGYFHLQDVEGADVSELLKIEKWEAAEETTSNGGVAKTAGAGKFPSFIRKTDQERVQNSVNELGKHLDETFQVTIKLDGSSMTVFHVAQGSVHYDHAMADIDARLFKGLGFFKAMAVRFKRLFKGKPQYLAGVCSRNIELPLDGANHFSQYVRENQMVESLQNLCLNIAVQGELIGPGIQGNYENVKENEFYVYDVFDIDAQTYMLPKHVVDIAMSLGWKHVPVLNRDLLLGSLLGIEPRQLVESILTSAEGPGMNPGVKREGLVFKSNSSEFSFKAISNSYLLKKEGKQ